MSTGNPGVSPERPQPVPLNTLTLGAGQGISWVRVQVWQGFNGIRVEWRVTHNFGDTVIYKFNYKLHPPFTNVRTTCQLVSPQHIHAEDGTNSPYVSQSLVGGGQGPVASMALMWPSLPFEIPSTPASSTKASGLGGSTFAQLYGRNFEDTA